jgi:hypothetical protein
LDCADGKVRLCYLIVATWIADYMEYVLVARMISGFCPVCEIPKNAMGHDSGTTVRTDRLSTNEYPRRDKLKYQHALESGDSHCLKDYGLQSEENPLWDFPACDPY